MDQNSVFKGRGRTREGSIDPERAEGRIVPSTVLQQATGEVDVHFIAFTRLLMLCTPTRPLYSRPMMSADDSTDLELPINYRHNHPSAVVAKAIERQEYASTTNPIAYSTRTCLHRDKNMGEL